MLKERGVGVERPEEIEDGEVDDTAPVLKPISTEEMEQARRLVDEKRSKEEDLKALAYAKHKEAEAAYDKFYDEQDIVSHNEESLKLREQLSELKERLKTLEEDLVNSQKDYGKASSWSFRHKAKLQEKLDNLPREIEKLKIDVKELNDLVLTVSNAEKYIRSHTESELKRAVEATKLKMEVI